MEQLRSGRGQRAGRLAVPIYVAGAAAGAGIVGLATAMPAWFAAVSIVLAVAAVVITITTIGRQQATPARTVGPDYRVPMQRVPMQRTPR